MAQINYKRKKLQSGDFRTPATFHTYINRGPYPQEVELEQVYQCFVETYSPSIKDMEILDVAGHLTGLTMVMRDPLQSYQPRNEHVVKIEDYRLEVNTFNIKAVRLDTPERGFITLVLMQQ
ncbi:hypothetical protein [Staphylococcus pseudintermedius]|uniref:hypothetical protein n=1 Tax=Staphylococcus pseudintermedius TaxID=283734 RepID=UPI000C1B821E|nr:hypothetical protein [Staphylococcus pseudintermedius]EHV5284079.1 hypothetical protein [Staphylococcus pseudintermedius]ELI4021249.1 hypothetical protein [Staphylococcus pseudintermedius]ELN1785432.1 hypothetical protein [Staphylococcus pseudintermedius]MDU9318492.1 hypothetical protein [Staphylococcus pseudintermedius]HCT0519507.1 hypothetical protein [Staphylococcus pseudintermedius]